MTLNVLKTNLNYILQPLPVSLRFEKRVVHSLKLSKIMSLYKSGYQRNRRNSISIPIALIIPKVYQKVIANQFNDYLNKNKILNKNQFGFRAGRCSQRNPIACFFVHSTTMV